ncbi:putative ribonuclease H-like domain-containing protein, partial [Tanacetum coccineum]
FKLYDESQVVHRAPRKDDVYSLDLKNIVPSGGITYLYANAIFDEPKLWHKRLGHVNFKNINKLVKGHLVRGLPSKVFVNDYTCVACKKGKQHKASCKAKLERTIRKPLELLHMDLFGPVSVESINKKRDKKEFILRQDSEIPQSQGPTITPVPDEATTTRVGVDTEGATTTTTGLDAGLDRGNIHESPLRSHEAPLPEGNTSGSTEDSLKIKELMAIVPKPVTRIDSLEKDLKETKQTLGNVVLTLVKKVKSLEVALKRKTKKAVLSDSEDEETENQGRNIQDIDDDHLVSLVRDFVTPTKTKVSASGEAQEEDISPTTLEAAKTLLKVASQKARSTNKGKRFQRRTRSTKKGKDISTGLDAEVEINTGSEDVNTYSTRFNTGSIPVSTPSIVQKVNVIVPSPNKGQKEGKAQMIDEDVQATQNTKEQIRQEEPGLAEAMRLQAQLDEE